MFLSSDARTVEMVEQLVGRAQLAMVNFLNEAAQEIHHRAQEEVPKSEGHHERPGHPNYPPESLEEASYVVSATVETLQSHVVYPGPYAAAQEVGRMEYRSRGGKAVEWEAEHYTTTGTKSHYLADAGKSAMGGLPEQLAIEGHRAFGDIPGVVVTPQSMTSAGRRAEAAPEVQGEIGRISQRESVTIQSVSPTSLTEVPGGHPPTLQ